MFRWFATLAVLLAFCANAMAQVCQTWDGQGGKGSAVCVGLTEKEGDGIFLTAGHVAGRGSLWLAPEGRWLRAKPLAWSDEGIGRDFAIVQLPGYRPQRSYDIGTTSPPIGGRVKLCGFAEGGELRVIPTEVIRHGKGYVDLDTAGIPGISGGPILVGRTVVGILSHNARTPNSPDAAVCTNIETINATLKAWGLAPGGKEVSQTGYVGVGVGMQCGPFGCVPRCGPYGCPRPMEPVYPAMPAPQRPGYPGWESAGGPDPRITDPPRIPDDPEPPARNPPPSVVAYDDSNLKRRLGELEQVTGELELATKALSARMKSAASVAGPPGPQGPPGEPGRDGVDGKPGRDADTSEINARLARLESTTIPVRVLDGQGNVIDEQRYKLGEPLDFRLVPRSK